MYGPIYLLVMWLHCPWAQPSLRDKWKVSRFWFSVWSGSLSVNQNSNGHSCFLKFQIRNWFYYFILLQYLLVECKITPDKKDLVFWLQSVQSHWVPILPLNNWYWITYHVTQRRHYLHCMSSIVDVGVACIRKCDILSNREPLVSANYSPVLCSYLWGPLP